MVEDTEAARKARAERLHQQIDRMKTEKKEEKAPDDEVKRDTPPVPSTETPAEFIHRKMHELDKKK